LTNWITDDILFLPGVVPWENIKFEVCPLANIWQYLFKNSKVEFKNL
jgi:hypothetical protein